ncbi:MAG TPA: fatty acid desaturase family protein [Myxococcota bacterium]|jgi:fatty acid desaturase|nr:fatty acid desaturase family protein [Myxococcota bacterium]
MSASPTTPEAVARERWLDRFTRDEIDSLRAMEDWRSWLSIGLDWALVALSMAAVAAWPNPLTILLAVFVIGARQLGMAILMHEASHRTLFSDRRLNDWAGNWLCAYPVWGDLHPYRGYHLQHHAKTGTSEDPDLGLAAPFPVTRSSLRRKVWRDLSGQTGVKRAIATLRRDLGASRGRVRRDDAGIGSLQGVVITNVVLLALCAAFGHPLLYLLWPAAWLTTYSLAMRIRSIAEHGMVPDPLDDLRNTRTTLASWWERLLIAPNRVNFHLEHHLLMTVPHYHLPRMHRMLRERGLLEGSPVAHGYAEVLRLASSRPEGAPGARQAGPTETALTQRPPF